MTKRNIIIIISLVTILSIAGFLILKKSPNQNTPQVPNTPISTTENNQLTSKYKGKILAGNNSPYLEFNLEDYQNAQREGKIIILNFYANWCPICRAEAPEWQNAFNELNDENIVGFRINFNDSDTDDSEKNVAKQFGVTYQHTKVILQSDKKLLQETVQWDKEKIVEELSKAKQSNQ